MITDNQHTIFSKNFNEAINDYFTLIEKKYPQKSILELVGTRYNLDRTQRSVLYRGVTTRKKAISRFNKLITENERITNNKIHIDCFNLLFTISSYLNGNLVYIGMDGFLRDTAESQGKGFNSGIFERCFDLILTYFKSYQPGYLLFYIDEPVDKSQELKHLTDIYFIKSNIDYKIILHKSPDRQIKGSKTGLIATSDSAIIDKSTLPVIDLAKNILKHHFDPKFFSMKAISF